MAIANELRPADRLPQLPRLHPRGDGAAADRVPGRADGSRPDGGGLPHARRRRAHRARVVETGERSCSTTRSTCEFAVEIPGTAQIEESIIAVPLHYGARVIGAIVVSKLGLDQFDEDDLRLLEVLAGHAAVALENARLYEAQRREAESAKALLEFGRELAAAEGLEQRARTRRRGRAAADRGAPHASLWLQEPIGGDVVGERSHGYEIGAPVVGSASRRRDAEFLAEQAVLTPGRVRGAQRPVGRGHGLVRRRAVHPRGTLGCDRGGRSARGRVRRRASCELLGGLAHQAKLAIANASSFEGLERTFLSTVEALANALEADDEYTSSHARWITDMALRVGSELGLDGDTLKRLELGALFHDIGKIGIPNSVLLEAGAADARRSAC